MRVMTLLSVLVQGGQWGDPKRGFLSMLQEESYQRLVEEILSDKRITPKNCIPTLRTSSEEGKYPSVTCTMLALSVEVDERIISLMVVPEATRDLLRKVYLGSMIYFPFALKHTDTGEGVAPNLVCTHAVVSAIKWANEDWGDLALDELRKSITLPPAISMDLTVFLFPFPRLDCTYLAYGMYVLPLMQLCPYVPRALLWERNAQLPTPDPALYEEVTVEIPSHDHMMASVPDLPPEEVSNPMAAQVSDLMRSLVEGKKKGAVPFNPYN